jgi:hypothetical protein
MPVLLTKPEDLPWMRGPAQEVMALARDPPDQFAYAGGTRG